MNSGPCCSWALGRFSGAQRGGQDPGEGQGNEAALRPLQGSAGSQGLPHWWAWVLLVPADEGGGHPASPPRLPLSLAGFLLSHPPILILGTKARRAHPHSWRCWLSNSLPRNYYFRREELPRERPPSCLSQRLLGVFVVGGPHPFRETHWAPRWALTAGLLGSLQEAALPSVGLCRSVSKSVCLSVGLTPSLPTAPPSCLSQDPGLLAWMGYRSRGSHEFKVRCVQAREWVCANMCK